MVEMMTALVRLSRVLIFAKLFLSERSRMVWNVLDQNAKWRSTLKHEFCLVLRLSFSTELGLMLLDFAAPPTQGVIKWHYFRQNFETFLFPLLLTLGG